MFMEILRPFGAYEFFAGGGMARLGLGAAWKCLFANDFDAKKAAAYRENHGSAELVHGDVRKLTTADLPGHATLAWASFPCQDLSLAGAGAGLAGERSGVFWPFWQLMQNLRDEGRQPPIIALENVSGLITSHGGADLTGLLTALSDSGYRAGAVLLDGAYFVPQSRPRLFIIAVARGVTLPKGLTARVPNPSWHPESLCKVVNDLPTKVRKSWLWWKMPMPTKEAPHLLEIIEHEPTGVEWYPESETTKLLSMMTPGNLEKVREAQRAGTLQVGTIYKRTRQNVQRAEIRFDGVSGCLRTPAGGSSRQVVMVVEGERIRSRLISPRETARLMGLPDTYKLPKRYNDTYHLTGDGVVVPAVAWIEQHILRQLGIAAQRVVGQQTVEEVASA